MAATPSRTPPLSQTPPENPMQIQLNTDVHIEATKALTAQVRATVEQALKRFSEHVTRVEVHLSDENGGKSGQHDQRCMLEARLEGRQPVAVTEHAATLEQAVHGAAQKLTHLLDSTLGRLHDHHEKTSGLPLSGTEPAQR
jgi:ribosome-associated translation inhibitor RaiA